jgi:hypothetical protein
MSEIAPVSTDDSMVKVTELHTRDGQQYLTGPKLVRLSAPRRPELTTLDNVRQEMGRVYRMAKHGRMRTDEASRLTFMLGEIRKAIAEDELAVKIMAEIKALKDARAK